MKTTFQKSENQIFFNQQAHKREVEKLENFIQSINNFGNDLEKQDLKLTPEILTDFMEKGYPAIADQIVLNFMLKGDKSAHFLEGQSRAAANREAVLFQPYFHKFTSHNLETGLSVNQIPVKEGKAYISGDIEKEMISRHTVELDPARKAEFEKLKAFAKAFNECSAFTKESGRALSDELLQAFNDPLYFMGELQPTAGIFITSQDGQSLEVNPYYFK